MTSMLDASALLAFIRAEPGHEKVAAHLETGARACAVNLSEVMAVLVRNGIPAEEAAGIIGDLPLETVDFDLDLATRAGALIRFTRRLGLAFGDRACLAAGMRHGDTVVTADQVWLSLAPELDAAIELIRPAGLAVR